MRVRSRDCWESSSVMENGEKTFQCPAGSFEKNVPKKNDESSGWDTKMARKMQQNLNFPSARVQKMLPKWYWYRHISHVLIEKCWIGIGNSELTPLLVKESPFSCAITFKFNFSNHPLLFIVSCGFFPRLTREINLRNVWNIPPGASDDSKAARNALQTSLGHSGLTMNLL